MARQPGCLACDTRRIFKAQRCDRFLWDQPRSAIIGAQPPDPSSLLLAINPQGPATGNLAGTTTNGGQFGIGTVFTLTPAGVSNCRHSAVGV